jgi:hypothetical protein
MLFRAGLQSVLFCRSDDTTILCGLIPNDFN